MLIEGLIWDTTDGRYSVLFILEYWRIWLNIILDIDVLWEYFLLRLEKWMRARLCVTLRAARGTSRF